MDKNLYGLLTLDLALRIPLAGLHCVKKVLVNSFWDKDLCSYIFLSSVNFREFFYEKQILYTHRFLGTTTKNCKCKNLKFKSKTQCEK